jgi:hypothetical protein
VVPALPHAYRGRGERGGVGGAKAAVVLQQGCCLTVNQALHGMPAAEQLGTHVEPPHAALYQRGTHPTHRCYDIKIQTSLLRLLVQLSDSSNVTPHSQRTAAADGDVVWLLPAAPQL